MDLKLSNQNLKCKQRGRGRNRKEEGQGTEVATVRRNSDWRKEMQEAEYRNRKKGMETGWTEEEKSTGGTAVREKREEGKRKNGRLSSKNRTEVDERKRKRGKSPKAKA